MLVYFWSVKNLILILFVFCLNSVAFSDNADKGKTTTKSISGKVTDAYGEALPGSKIVVKETGETFFADLEGSFHFTLKTDQIYSLCVETIGFQPKELKSSELSFFSELSLTSL